MLAHGDRKGSGFTNLSKGFAWDRAAFPPGHDGTGEEPRLCWCSSSLRTPQTYTAGENGVDGIFIPILGVPARSVSSSSASEAGPWNIFFSTHSLTCTHIKRQRFHKRRPVSHSFLWAPQQNNKNLKTCFSISPLLIFPKPGEKPIPDDCGAPSKHSSSCVRPAFLLETTNIHHCSPPAYTLSTFTSFKPATHSEGPGAEAATSASTTEIQWEKRLLKKSGCITKGEENKMCGSSGTRNIKNSLPGLLPSST